MDNGTPEQAARDLLERMGMADAQSKSAGDVLELAELIASVRRFSVGYTVPAGEHEVRVQLIDATGEMVRTVSAWVGLSQAEADGITLRQPRFIKEVAARTFATAAELRMHGWHREGCVALEQHERDIFQMALEANEVLAGNEPARAALLPELRAAHVATLRARAVLLEHGGRK